MIRIAILDDNPECAEELHRMIDVYALKEKKALACKVYISAMELLFDLDQGQYYDIFLLDVEMPVHSGLEVAFEIRKKYIEPVIIYITDYVKYAVQAFEVNAYKYIPKSCLDTKLPEALDAIIPILENKKKRHYLIKHYLDVETLQYDNIYFLKKEGKYVVFIHRDGESRVRKALQNVLKELDSEEFIEIGKGRAVNILHVMSLEQQCVIMRNGLRLPVSRSLLAEIQERIMEYWNL